jgi:hypothetical protein
MAAALLLVVSSLVVETGDRKVHDWKQLKRDRDQKSAAGVLLPTHTQTHAHTHTRAHARPTTTILQSCQPAAVAARNRHGVIIVIVHGLRQQITTCERLTDKAKILVLCSRLKFE